MNFLSLLSEASGSNGPLRDSAAHWLRSRCEALRYSIFFSISGACRLLPSPRKMAPSIWEIERLPSPLTRCSIWSLSSSIPSPDYIASYSYLFQPEHLRFKHPLALQLTRLEQALLLEELEVVPDLPLCLRYLFGEFLIKHRGLELPVF